MSDVIIIFVTNVLLRSAKINNNFELNKHLSDYFTPIVFHETKIKIMEQETINKRICYIIKKEGHTVGSFAKKMNVRDQTIRNITIGRNKPGYDVIVKIIDSFEWVDANWLIMGQKNHSDSDSDKEKLYSVIATQQKTIEKQQETIDRLTFLLVQRESKDHSKKATNAG